MRLITVILPAITGLLCSACADNPKAKTELNQGYVSLEARQYDQAISIADGVLQKTPSGPGTAEALYLKGRALELKAAGSVAESRANWQAARVAYIDGLGAHPARKVEALLHAGVANVAYFQDDYATAVTEWSTAYNQSEDPTTKAWALYRIGLCRQRMGQFQEADRIFASVSASYPNTAPAQRAQEHQGARGFSVQFATFASVPNADAAVTSLRQGGVLASRQADAQGRSVVRSSSMPTYQQAKAIQSRYADRYPDALIVP